MGKKGQEYKYMVCTHCFTFNHAPYIVDAMNGFTMQETTFPVITLIVDDASTDGEQEVIKQYLADHFQSPYRKEETENYHLICTNHNTNPNCTFVVFLLKYNHHSIKKPKLPYLSEWNDNAKYYAFCEGDDYWVDPHKLQMQVRILNNDKNVGIVYGKAQTWLQEKQRWGKSYGSYVKDVNELIIANKIPTLTTMIRSDLYLEYHNNIKLIWKAGDYPLWLWIISKSKPYFISNSLGVYRVLKNSASHYDNLKDRIEFQRSIYEMKLYFSNILNISNKEVLAQKYNETIFNLAFQSGDFKIMYSYYKKLECPNIKDMIKYYILKYKLFWNILRRINII